MNKPEWFWAHRRTASLHHFSFLMHGMRFRGWEPAVQFWFDNQICVGVPGKGSYVFYDARELGKHGMKLKDIQESIDANPEFVRDFKKRTNELFGAVFFKCLDIEAENLELLSNEDLGKLYREFLDAIMVGPIISVQLWGIEACFDEEYRIMRFLRNRTQELGKSREFEMYKAALAVNTGETVAFTEQKNFYQVAAELAKNPEIMKLFDTEDMSAVKEGLTAFLRENRLIDNHAKKYEWINTEYTSGGWSKEKWLSLFSDALHGEISPAMKLEELFSGFRELNVTRERAIEELDPPRDVRHALDALRELIAQRDWTKGYMTKAFLSYHKLLDEIGRRVGASREDLFLHSYIEVAEALEAGKGLSEEELENRRKNGYLFRIIGGEFSLVTGSEAIQHAIEEERIAEPFAAVSNTTEFKGLPASRGTITGKARVIEDASRIGELEAGEILVTYMTTIEFIPAFRKAAAVVTDEGGMSCHAAIISREFKLPCVVGTKVATRALSTGDLIEVDATAGVIRILERAGEAL